MSKKEKVNLPPSGGGIFRTYDEEGTGIKLKPEHIIGVCIVVIICEVVLHFYGSALF